MQNAEAFEIAGQKFSSRLLFGTGRYPSPAILQEALTASEAEIVTFALRRMDLDAVEDDSILQHIIERPLQYLPNTSGAQTAEEAVRIAQLSRGAGLGKWIKVEISAHPRTLLPDPFETLKATEMLVKLGYVVLPYISDDPPLCRKLEEAGAAAVMPGGSPIGTGLGILNPYNIGLITEDANVPIIVDAGIGSPKDALAAMELGASGVLINTAIAKAKNPVAMAQGFKLAIEAGVLSRAAGRIERKRYASASSELAGSLFERWSEDNVVKQDLSGQKL